MGEWTGYNANNDMDKRTKFAFNQLSEEDKKYIEDAWHEAKDAGRELTDAELKSAVKIRASKSLIKDRKAEWEKGNFPNQKTDPERAKDYLDQIIGIHQNIIKENKAAHQGSEFIQEANLLDKGIRTLKDAGKNVGGGILKIARALDPFGAAHAATNQKKDDFTFKLDQDDSFINRYALAEEQMGGSNKGSRSYHPAYDDRNTVLDKDLEPFDRQFPDTVYEDIGDYANRKIPGLEVKHNLYKEDTNWLRDKQYEGDYIIYEPQEAQTWLEKHNAAQRAYNDTTGLNTNYYAGSLQGNIDTAARVGRRNQARIDNVLGDFISGKSKMSIPGRHNLVGFLGTPKQQEIYLHEYGKQTGMNPNGTQWSNPWVDQNLYKDPDQGGIIGTIDPYGNTITRDTINQDVTGMYTPSGSSGMDDIADVTTTESSSASPNDGWSEMTFARGGRIGYAEGGIVNLLPKGAW